MASISGQSYQGLVGLGQERAIILTPFSFHLRCYADNVNSRLFPYVDQGNDATLTPQQCTSACNGMGYDLSGLEYRESKSNVVQK